MKSLRRRQCRLSRGEPRYSDRYLNRSDRLSMDGAMQKLLEAARKTNKLLKTMGW